MLLVRKNKVCIKIGQHPKREQFHSHPNREYAIIAIYMMLHKRNICTMFHFPIECIKEFLVLMRT